MTFDYFYGEQSEQFSFYRIPKVLFTDEYFKEISPEAKILYGILLDRMSLSAKNGWTDDEGRVYIIFTTEEVMNAMGCADNKATKLLSELENKAGLIVRKRQGLGKPNRIYVKNFVSSGDCGTDPESVNTVSPDGPEAGMSGSLKQRSLNRDYHDSAGGQNTIQQSLKSRCNNTDINDTDFSDTKSFSSIREGRNETDERCRIESYLRDALEMDILIHDLPGEADTLEGIFSLIVDVCCTKKPFIRVGGEDKPAEVVKSQFMKLNSEHIRYVLKSLNDNTVKIRDPKPYLITALYNAPQTMGPYYRSWVNSDMAAMAAGSGGVV